MRKSNHVATIAPMEALLVERLPAGNEWQYEPKWDGFRCIAFRRREIVLQSKSEKPLTRYFPEIVSALQEVKAKRFILDGELAVQSEGHFDFDALLQRIHPAESRVRKLSVESPATFIVFDLLEDDSGKSLLEMPLAARRRRLEPFFQKYLSKNATFALSPATTDPAQAQAWCNSSLGNVDGIMAKRLDLHYCSGDRTGMQKFKWMRTADCVVGEFRYGTDSNEVGSLLLGLYDDDGRLHHVGFCSGIAAAEKPSLTKKLENLIKPPGFTGRAPGGPSRWSIERSAEWKPLKPALIAEVRFDHASGERFRHGTKFLRWRQDKKPSQCTMIQLSQTIQSALPIHRFPR